jgi:hypothetical protein
VLLGVIPASDVVFDKGEQQVQEFKAIRLFECPTYLPYLNLYKARSTFLHIDG